MNHKIAIGLLSTVFAIPGAAIAADTMKADTKAEAKTSTDKGTVKGSVKNAAAEVKETLSDSAITAKIKADYAKDKTVSALDIKVDTDNKGMVTLSGNAKSKAEADKAVSIAKATKGVTSVKNDIKVGASDMAKSDMSKPESAPAKSAKK